MNLEEAPLENDHIIINETSSFFFSLNSEARVDLHLAQDMFEVVI